MSFNKVLILGNAAAAPEVRHLDGGGVVANFRVATSEVFTDRSGNRTERTEWHNIVCWRRLAEFAEKYIQKGTQVFIEGRISTREYTDQTGQKRYRTEIVADNIQLTGRRPEGQGGAQPQGGYQSQGSYQQPYQKPVQPAPQAPSAPQDFPAMDEFNDTGSNDLPF
ncbi:MAG: single-stranded DNA-binding protein [Bacteroidales bacterium]|nr:single-stranded DNA-binding protein [Bacteroidales bacterium]